MPLTAFLCSEARAVVTTGQRSSRMILMASAFAIAAIVGTPVARAEIIIDDFDDPVQIVLPEMKDEPQTTESVGGFFATRLVFVGDSQTDPLGVVDVDVTKSSHLTARVDGQFLDNPLNTPLLSIGSGYDFGGPTDLTENGVNDALLIDFSVFQGSGIPPAMTVLVRDSNFASGLTFAAIVSGFGLPSDSPYTLAIPFNSFGRRGGGGGAVDFSTVDLLEVRVRLLQGSRDPNTQWFFQIDRIRVGRVVPEPSTGALLTMTVLAVACIQWTRRRKVDGPSIEGSNHASTINRYFGFGNACHPTTAHPSDRGCAGNGISPGG